MNQKHIGFAEAFCLLAEFYKYPNDEFYQAIKEKSMQMELNQYLQTTELQYDINMHIPFRSLDDMKDEYTKAFVGIQNEAAAPIESVYKVWTEDESSSMGFAKSKGYLMGDAAVHVQYILDQLGIELPEHLGKKPDHISVLLELLGYYIEHVGIVDVRQFLADHFDWLQDFSNKLLEVEAHEFYQEITKLLIVIISDFQKVIEDDIQSLERL